MTVPFGFDPNPRELEKSQHGWLYCETCEAPREAKGHECIYSAEASAAYLDFLESGDPVDEARFEALLERHRNARQTSTLARDYWRDDGNPLSDDWQGRAELAESVLMGLAFDHMVERMQPYDAGPDFVPPWPACDRGCVFCDARQTSAFGAGEANEHQPSCTCEGNP